MYITSGCSDALRICIDAIGSPKRNILLPSPGKATDLNQELDCQGIQLYITKSVHSQALPMFASKLVGLLQISSKLTDIEYFEANHANLVICLL